MYHPRQFTKIKLSFIVLSSLLLSACSMDILPTEGPQTFVGGEPLARLSTQYVPLGNLPKRDAKITVAVYDFPDLTGANLTTETGSSFSKAMTQGADALVLNALNTTGDGSWFRVLERRFLDALLNERRIGASQINETRQRLHVQAERTRLQAAQSLVEKEIQELRRQIEFDYDQAQKENRLDQLPPFDQSISNLERYRQDQLNIIPRESPFSTFVDEKPVEDLRTAQYLVSGAIIGYESDIISSGNGIRIVNTGAVNEERKDMITLNLRFVDAVSGEIVSNSTVSQAVISRRDQGDFMNYVTVNTILEFEAGMVINEPRTLALDAAIRLALSENIQILKTKGII